MTLPVSLRDEAVAEFDEAFDWYNSQKPGLGTEFVEEVQKVFDRVGDNPKMHGLVLADVRKAVVRRFPYCVFYRPHSSYVEVLAVFHSSRNPSIWQERA